MSKELTMSIAELFKQYLEHLFSGKRSEARELVLAAQDRGMPASQLLRCIIWPAMDQVEKLYRNHQINRIMEHMATRINRMIADILHNLLARKPKSGKRMVVACGEGEMEELGAQITADLFEATGWSVWFIGSGVPNDEMIQFLGKLRPEILCLYGAQPSSVPQIRCLIEQIHEMGHFQDMQVLVSGGVFARAQGLCEEIKADLFASDVTEALKVVEEHPVRVPQPDMPQPGRRRKSKALRPLRKDSPTRTRTSAVQ